MVLQVTSGSLGEAGHMLLYYRMLRIGGVVLSYPSVEHEGALWLFVFLIASCNELW